MSKTTPWSSSQMNTENHCYSKVDPKKCSFTWTIDHYESIHKKIMKKSILKSTAFSASNDNFKWYLEHHFSEFCRLYQDPIDYVALYLKLDSRDVLTRYGSVVGRITFFLMKPDSKKSSRRSKKFTFDCSKSVYKTGFEEFIKLSDLCEDWLFEDKCTIVCKLTYVKNDDIVHISTSLPSNPLELSESTLLRDFEKLLNDKLFHDVTISVEGKTFPVYKGILAARSSVFNAMFRNDMQENASNNVIITDINKKTFEKMLQYIYTGKVKNLDESAFDLLPAADKYNLEELRSMCEEALSKKLSKDDAIKILILADMHHADRLKTSALQFIRLHTLDKNVKNTELWNILTTSHPHLMEEMLTAVLMQ